MVLVPIHVTAGLLAIGAGAVALYAVKGEWLHRRSGMAFVIAMLVMASTGAVMAALKPDRGTALGGVMVFYIVCTGVLTVRRTVEQSRGLLTSLMLLALTSPSAEFALGFAARARSPDESMAILRVSISFSAASQRCARSAMRDAARGRARRRERLVRHIWRMSFAMWFATASFFLGQAKVFPEPLRHAFGLRAIPVVLVLVVMFYWLGRVQLKRHRPNGLPLRRRADVAMSVATRMMTTRERETTMTQETPRARSPSCCCCRWLRARSSTSCCCCR